jgi:hypothetical protein
LLEGDLPDSKKGLDMTCEVVCSRWLIGEISHPPLNSNNKVTLFPTWYFPFYILEQDSVFLSVS